MNAIPRPAVKLRTWRVMDAWLNPWLCFVHPVSFVNGHVQVEILGPEVCCRLVNTR